MQNSTTTTPHNYTRVLMSLSCLVVANLLLVCFFNLALSWLSISIVLIIALYFFLAYRINNPVGRRSIRAAEKAATYKGLKPFMQYGGHVVWAATPQEAHLFYVKFIFPRTGINPHKRFYYITLDCHNLND